MAVRAVRRGVGIRERSEARLEGPLSIRVGWVDVARCGLLRDAKGVRSRVKTHQLDRQEIIRSRSIEGVKQERWGILLTYNLIRREMECIADEAKVAPSRISFVAAMRFIRDEWHWCALASPGSIPA